MLIEGDLGGVPLAEDEPDVYRLLPPLPALLWRSTDERAMLNVKLPATVHLLRKLVAEALDDGVWLAPSKDCEGARTEPR
jgi:hypothetical protein